MLWQGPKLHDTYYIKQSRSSKQKKICYLIPGPSRESRLRYLIENPSVPAFFIFVQNAENPVFTLIKLPISQLKREKTRKIHKYFSVAFYAKNKGG